VPMHPAMTTLLIPRSENILAASRMHAIAALGEAP
jgi:hypothetical protein